MAHYSTHRLLKRHLGALFGLTLCVACASHPPSTPNEQIQSGVEALRNAAGAAIHDPQSATRAQEAANEMGKELLAFEALAETYRGKLLTLNARPDATRAEFESLGTEFDSQRAERRRRLLGLHTELLSDTTIEEWKVLAPLERTLLSVPME